MVIVSSDHGPGHYSGRQRKAIPLQMKEMEKEGHFSRGQWRGYKFSSYEGGLRVPFGVVWPGVVEPGSQNDSMVGLNDLMATCADIAGVELKDNQGPDSISFLPYLRNQEILVRNHMVAHGTRADAYYEGNWKLILGPGSGSSGGHFTEPKSEDAWKLAIQKFGRKPKDHAELEHPTFLQLYDLAADPGEKNNLASIHFERAKKMIDRYKKVVADGRSTRGPKLPNGREIKIFRPPGFIWKK
jgi:arylsulfatase A-like enzyme